jgi:4-aminobutyrate aminotransferase-like enzyme
MKTDGGAIHEDTDSIPNGMGRHSDPIYGPNFVRGAGSWLWDEAGNKYLDCTTGYSALNFGHCHPVLTAAATEQLGCLTHLTGQRHPWRGQLCERIAQEFPSIEDCKVWLVTTGTRAVELAWKIAWQRRPGCILHFSSSYHGRSIATSALSATKQLPICPDLRSEALSYPDCAVCPFKLHPDSCNAECFTSVEKQINEQSHRASAVIVEPAIGARGYLFPPHVFFEKLRRLTQACDLLLISDEIQMGMGRIGQFSASQWQGWRPDLVLLGKSLGGGIVPISAVVGSKDLIDSLESGIDSETFAASPFACRIALASIDLLTENDNALMRRAIQVGQLLRQGLANVLQESCLESNFETWMEGTGACAAIEFFASRPDHGSHLARKITEQAMHLGLLVHYSGPRQNRIVFIPPLTIADEEIDLAVDVFHRAVPAAVSEG